MSNLCNSARRTIGFLEERGRESEILMSSMARSGDEIFST